MDTTNRQERLPSIKKNLRKRDEERRIQSKIRQVECPEGGLDLQDVNYHYLMVGIVGNDADAVPGDTCRCQQV